MRGITNNMFRAMKITVAAASVSLLWGVGGCVSYTNVPEPTSGPAFGHANSGASIKVTAASIERVVLRHPMRDDQGRYAVNLPAGTTLETAQAIVSKLPEGAIVPFEGMDDSVPVYHIGRIWLRGVRGKVDVVYPLEGELDGGVTLWVHGGNRPWYVERMQYWAPGTVPTPPVYVPIGQFERDVEVVEPVELVDEMNETSEPVIDDSDEVYRQVDE